MYWQRRLAQNSIIFFLFIILAIFLFIDIVVRRPLKICCFFVFLAKIKMCSPTLSLPFVRPFPLPIYTACTGPTVCHVIAIGTCSEVLSARAFKSQMNTNVAGFGKIFRLVYFWTEFLWVVKTLTQGEMGDAALIRPNKKIVVVLLTYPLRSRVGR